MAINVRSHRSILLVSILLISLSVFFFHDSITLFPSFIHAWTQSDRYALALGFLRNGFDFFHPQTFNLVTTGGITRVDFPIHEFTVALIMKLTGNHDPVIFRCYTLLYALTGLVFLFRLSELFINSFFRNLLVVMFLFLCPVFLYYANGFIPSIPSLANLFIGYFFYFRYKREKTNRDFRLAILFFTLAALARLPFFIFLFAVFCQQCLGYISCKKVERKEIRPLIISFSLFGFYQLYNSWLGHKYGTQFLISFLPPSSGKQLSEWVAETWQHWRYEYFSGPQYLIIMLLFPVFIFQFINHRQHFSQLKDVFLQIGIAGIGSLLFFFLMLMQFPDHDYYFIDSFYPMAALALICLASITVKNKMFSYALGCVLAILISLSIVSANEVQQRRYTSESWDRVEISRVNFQETAKFLDSIGVPKDARVLVLDGYTTNVPLILMNRKGWTVNWTTRKKIEEGMLAPFDLVAIQNAFVASDVVKNDPALTTQLQKFADNGLVGFYRRNINPDRSLSQFLGIDSSNTVMTFTKIDSVQVGSNNEFFEILSDSLKSFPQNRAIKIFIAGEILRNNAAPQLIATSGTSGPASSYFSFNLYDYTTGSGSWEKMLFQFAIPAKQRGNGNVKVYLWNDQKGNFHLRNLKAVCYW